MVEAMVLPGLVSGTALVVAGALKAGRTAELRETFADLRVPRSLARPGVVRATPVVEIAVGVLLVVVPSPLVLVPAVLAAALLLAYVALVARVLVRGDDVSCACFGTEEPVGATTLARNVLLLAAAALAVADAVAGRSTLARLADLSSTGWTWLLGTAAVAALVVLAASRRSVPVGGVEPATGDAVPDGVRGIPFLQVHESDGTLTSLPELAQLRPQLLVHLSETCSRCEGVGDLLPAWRERLPAVDVRVLTGTAPGTPVPASWGAPVHDPAYSVATVLGLGLPSAVLLGADALIAGGPVHGRAQVVDLLEEIEGALAEESEARPL